MQFHMALNVIQRLDVAQEHRELSPPETRLRAALKRKVLGLASIERARKKQASRVTHIREGDANTKFFHLRVNARRRRNTIQRLKKDSGWAVTHGEKELTIHDHFASFMGRPGPRPNELNWETLDITPIDLATLGEPFTEEEVHRAIKEMPADKAPGPDGFTGAFFKVCWEIIKDDILLVFSSIYNLRCAHLNLLNSANIVLIPKKDGAESVSDYRPISLIHSIAKIFAKMLALRLRPHMHELISVNQSAFIKGRSIHDNYLFVRNMIRRYHRLRRAMLLFKLDITKAFDSVRWDYLLALLQRKGFPTRWIDWLGALLSSSTSQVLLNGSPGQRIKHGRGLRQGDPLSPLLFILAIDPLQRILSKATELGAISKLRGRTTRLQISMYADDAVIFINPTRNDVATFANILHRFGTATGLVTNLQKSQVAAIRCGNIDLEEVLQGVPAKRANFPLKYLGLPLALGRLRKTDLQPVFDKISGRVASWRGKNMAAAGRTTLVKSVLSAQPIYLLTALKVTKESLEQLDKQRHRFLWAGTGDITGGKCKVNWAKTCLPTSQGGLGVLSLDKFTRALRLRWLWNEWRDPSKPWVGLETPCDGVDRDLFAASTKITVGDGNTTRFWDSAWINGQRPKDLMPLVYEISKNRKKSLRQGKEDDSWVHDLTLDAGSSITINLLDQLVRLWEAVRNVHLDSEEPDQIVWKFTSSGHYTASSAYHAQCLGAPNTNFNSLIWKVWAPGKCKFHAWLIIQNRVWTSDRLATRGWRNNGHCPLCRCDTETALHLVAMCRYTKRIWRLVATWAGYQQLEPAQWEEARSVHQWWESLANTPGIPKKGLRSLILLVVWEIWKERNRRIFDHKEMATGVLLAKIKEEASLWALAGAKRLRELIPHSV